MTVREMKHDLLAKQWRSMIIECRQSGSSVAAWCAEHQVNKSTYYKWERKLLTKAGACEIQTYEEPRISDLRVPAFVEVTVPSQTTPTEDPPETAAGFIPDVVLRKGTVTIEVANSVSPQLLKFLKSVVGHAD